MKKITIILATFFCFAIFNAAQAQIKNNVIKTNLIGILGNQYQLAYERAFNEHMSAQLSVGYISTSSSQTIGSNSFESKTSGVIIIPEFRYYFTEAPKGVYVAPFARIRLVSEDLTDTSNPLNTDVSFEEKVSTVGGGAVFGYQFLIADAVALDIFLGPQYKSRSSSRTYDVHGVTDVDFSNKFIDFKIADKAGAGIRFGFNLGVAF